VTGTNYNLVQEPFCTEVLFLQVVDRRCWDYQTQLPNATLFPTREFEVELGDNLAPPSYKVWKSRSLRAYNLFDSSYSPINFFGCVVVG
jgi:hypothetical protein